MDPIILNEAPGRGLRPKRDKSRGGDWLRTMQNQLPFGDRGALTLRQITYPIDTGDIANSVTHPFPQVHRSEKTFLAFQNQEVWDLDVSSYPWPATQFTVYDARQEITNRFFDEDADWAKGSGWTITGGKAVGTSTSAALTQSGPLVLSTVYLVEFSVVVSAGSVTPNCGTQAGTTRSSTGTYYETITCSGGTDFSFTTSGFTGTIDNVSVVAQVTLASGGLGYNVCGFQDQVWFAHNQQNFLWRLPSNPKSAADTTVVVEAQDLNVGAVGKHNNAVVIGGMSGTRLNQQIVTDLFDHWRENQQQNQVTTQDDSLDDTYIFFSEMGGLANDLPFQVFLAALGYPDPDYEGENFKGIVHGNFEEGMLGFYRPQWCGAIRHLKQLGNDLICYGKDGICRLVRGESGYTEVAIEVVDESNMVQTLNHVGVPNNTSVCGSESMHYFVSNRGDLYVINGNSATRLDYSEYLETLTLTQVVASYDPIRSVSFFADSSDCFAYTGYGLGQSAAVRPTSLVRLDSDDTLLGCAEVASDPQQAVLEWTMISRPDRKTFEVSSMDVQCQEADASSWTAQAQWRLRSSDEFRRQTAVDVDDRGRAFVKRTGADFKPRLVAPNYKEVDCQGLMVNPKLGKPSMNAIMSGTDTILSETNK